MMMSLTSYRLKPGSGLIYSLYSMLLIGFGFGLLYVTAVVSVSLYFDKRRSLAVGIAMCGTGLGTFTFGPFGTWLLEHLDWKNVHFVFGELL